MNTGKRHMSRDEEEHSRHYDVLLDGGSFFDLIFTGLPGLPQLGREIFASKFDLVPGGAYTTAVALRRLGLTVGWVCDFGSDPFSKFALEAAQREGLDDACFRFHPGPVRCITVSLSYPRDRSFVTFRDNVAPPTLDPLIQQHHPRCVLLSCLQFGTATQETLSIARAHQCVIYMDCQQPAATLETQGVVEALRGVDVFAPNLAEALHLTGMRSAEEALMCLAALTPLVLLKLGSDGALACHEGKVIRQPAIGVNAVDTTGAGDCFNAGFLAGYVQGRPLEECLAMATICGGLSTTAPGGTAAPTATEVAQWLDQAAAGTHSGEEL